MLADQTDHRRAIDALARELRRRAAGIDPLWSATRFGQLGRQTKVTVLSPREAAERAFANRVVE